MDAVTRAVQGGERCINPVCIVNAKKYDKTYCPQICAYGWDKKRLEELEEQAEPVVHGRWIFKHNPIEDPKGYFIRIVCSECNLHTGQKSNYCPNCGAKMDGGDQHE